MKPGDRFAAVRLAPVTQRRVTAYVTAAGDDNPIHTDVDAARTAGQADIIVPGMLIAAQFPRVLEVWRIRRRLIGLSLRFVGPCLLDTGLEISGRVVAQTGAPARIVLRMIANQTGKPVVICEATLEGEAHQTCADDDPASPLVAATTRS